MFVREKKKKRDGKKARWLRSGGKSNPPVGGRRRRRRKGEKRKAFALEGCWEGPVQREKKQQGGERKHVRVYKGQKVGYRIRGSVISEGKGGGRLPSTIEGRKAKNCADRRDAWGFG